MDCHIHRNIFLSYLKYDLKYTSQSEHSVNYGVTRDTLVISLLLETELYECMYVHTSSDTHMCIQMAFAYPPYKFPLTN